MSIEQKLSWFSIPSLASASTVTLYNLHCSALQAEGLSSLECLINRVFRQLILLVRWGWLQIGRPMWVPQMTGNRYLKPYPKVISLSGETTSKPSITRLWTCPCLLPLLQLFFVLKSLDLEMEAFKKIGDLEKERALEIAPARYFAKQGCSSQSETVFLWQVA